jgi:hypothetical protein
MKERLIITTVLCLFLSSCSSMKKTIIYSSLSGGLAGATAGYALSPDKESQGANAAIFGVLGAGLSALIGYALFEDDPRNQKMNHMLEERKGLNPNSLGLDLGDLKIEANLSKEGVYKTPSMELPDELKGKVKKQYVIKYESKERYLHKGNKTYYVPSFKIFEHAYDEVLGAKENE